jgi:hypothetical protein
VRAERARTDALSVCGLSICQVLGAAVRACVRVWVCVELVTVHSLILKINALSRKWPKDPKLIKLAEMRSKSSMFGNPA